jgi:hypothetical protein
VKPKLTDEEVARIRQQYQYGRRPSVIAKEFKVNVPLYLAHRSWLAAQAQWQ